MEEKKKRPENHLLCMRKTEENFGQNVSCWVKGHRISPLFKGTSFSRKISSSKRDRYQCCWTYSDEINVKMKQTFCVGAMASWPAHRDICLGKRTIPVLAVAKEVAALQRWPRSRSGQAEDRSTTIYEETFCLGICLSFVWMFFFPSRSNNRLGLLI